MRVASGNLMSTRTKSVTPTHELYLGGGGFLGTAFSSWVGEVLCQRQEPCSGTSGMFVNMFWGLLQEFNALGMLLFAHVFRARLCGTFQRPSMCARPHGESCQYASVSDAVTQSPPPRNSRWTKFSLRLQSIRFHVVHFAFGI